MNTQSSHVRCVRNDTPHTRHRLARAMRRARLCACVVYHKLDKRRVALTNKAVARSVAVGAISSLRSRSKISRKFVRLITRHAEV